MEALYDYETVKHMEEELVSCGISTLSTPADVDAVLSHKEGTTLLVVNSICGCAAGSVRPGVAMALQHNKIPDRNVTVFAGMDREAVEQARSYLSEIPPSSPFVALFKGSEVVFHLGRYELQQLTPEMISEDLKKAFENHSSATGPSIPKEDFETLNFVEQCGFDTADSYKRM